MSLINQVLQDLETRGVSPSQADPIASQIRVVPRRASIQPLWLFGAALVLAAAAFVSWAALRDQSSGSGITPASPIPLAYSPAEVRAPAAAVEVAKPEAASPGSEIIGKEGQDEAGAMRLPAARLSHELSSAPAPAPAANPEPQETNPKPLSQPAKSAASAEISKPQGKPSPEAPKLTAVAPSSAPSPHTGAGDAAPQSEPSISKQIKQVTPRERAENEFRAAVSLMQQGRVAEALDGFAAALQFDETHDAARHAMTGLLLEQKRVSDAERLLQEGLKANPRQHRYAMTLARIQVEKGETQAALETLQKSFPYAENNADYQAFMAALWQRLSRHKDAVEHYQAAVRLSPQSGVWLMGLGISLQAEERLAEAQEAFKRAQGSNTLGPDLRVFVDERLKQIRQQLKP